MVDFADLGRVQNLWIEARQIDAAVANIDAGGVIVAVTISGDPPGQEPQPGSGFPPRLAAMVNTQSITYPPQMIDGIKSQLTARRAVIEQEMSALGVTMDQARAA